MRTVTSEVFLWRLECDLYRKRSVDLRVPGNVSVIAGEWTQRKLTAVTAGTKSKQSQVIGSAPKSLLSCIQLSRGPFNRQLSISFTSHRFLSQDNDVTRIIISKERREWSTEKFEETRDLLKYYVSRDGSVGIVIRRMVSSEILRRVALARTDVSKELAPPSSG
jgi:hypothetical protein